MQSFRRQFTIALMLATAFALPAAAATGDGKTETRLRFYRDHLDKYLKILRKADTLTPYYLAYRVNDTLYHSFQANRGGVIDGFAARNGIIYESYDGVLRSVPGLSRPPFELTLETPQAAALHLQVDALAAALQTILVEYRYLVAVAQNI